MQLLFSSRIECSELLLVAGLAAPFLLGDGASTDRGIGHSQRARSASLANIRRPNVRV